MLTLAACASTGEKGGLSADIPVVSDPAPYVTGTMRPYTVRGRTYRPAEQPDYDQTGLASWYGQYHHGRATSTGERFDMNALTAAHKTLPLPSMVEVTNPANGRRILVRVNDRGPFVDNRIIDLSRGAAAELGLLERGVGEVRVRYAGRAPRTGGGRRLADVGSRASRETARDVVAAPVTRSSTERPYSEVAAQVPAAQPAQQPRPRAGSPASRRGYEGTPTVRGVPIPQQPLPPAMPSRDAPAVAAPQPEVQSPPPAPVVATPQPAAPPSATPSVPAPVPATGTYRVQVSVFEQQVFAESVARQLGERAVVESFERNGRTLYRVVVGPWGDQAAAERSRQAIIARGFADALLIGD